MSDGRAYWLCHGCKTNRRGAVCKVCRIKREEAERKAREIAEQRRKGA